MVTNYYNYYAFGSMIPGRIGDYSGYRYGFNGQERDDNLNGGTASGGMGVDYSFKFREYDSRTGKFFSMDPLANRFPMYSPYEFAGNNPIFNIDEKGQMGTSYLTVIDKGGTPRVYVSTSDDYLYLRSADQVIPDRYDYVQYMTLDLQKNSISSGTKVPTTEVSMSEWARRKVVSARDWFPEGKIRDDYKKYYDKGHGGIMMESSAGQSGERRMAEFPDGRIMNLNDLLQISGNYGGSGGLGALSHAIEAIQNGTNSLDMVHYLYDTRVNPGHEAVSIDKLTTPSTATFRSNKEGAGKGGWDFHPGSDSDESSSTYKRIKDSFEGKNFDGPMYNHSPSDGATKAKAPSTVMGN